MAIDSIARAMAASGGGGGEGSIDDIISGDGISVTGGSTKTISNVGVRSVKASEDDGAISVNTGGTTEDIFIKGLVGKKSSMGGEVFNEALNAGIYAHAEGKSTDATGLASHAEGSNTTASEINAHAEGDHAKAIGSASHAEGLYTTASGANSHAEGDRTEAIGSASHTEGDHTVAIGNNQSVIGKYNTADADKAFIIGGGSNTDRKNIATVDWDGNVVLDGTVTAKDADGNEVVLNGIDAYTKTEVNNLLAEKEDNILSFDTWADYEKVKNTIPADTYFVVKEDEQENPIPSHNSLMNRDANECHPIKSITGLQAELDKKTDADDTAVLKARVDQLVGEVPPGSADEIADARVMIDGKTSQNLGDAIRTQVTSLKETIHNGLYQLGNHRNFSFSVSDIVDRQTKSNGELYDETSTQWISSDKLFNVSMFENIVLNTPEMRGYIYYYTNDFKFMNRESIENRKTLSTGSAAYARLCLRYIDEKESDINDMTSKIVLNCTTKDDEISEELLDSKISTLEKELKDETVEVEKTGMKKYTPAFDYKRARYIVEDGELKEDGYVDATKIYKCPKLLLINFLTAAERLYLYVGDIVDGVFVPDKNYIFNVTSAGYANYCNQANFIPAKIEEGKYFYIGKSSTTGNDFEVYGTDIDFRKCYEVNNYIPFSASPNTGGITNPEKYYSCIIPSDSYYIVIPDTNDRSAIYTFMTKDATVNPDKLYVESIMPNKWFGFVPSGRCVFVRSRENERFGKDIHVYLIGKQYENPHGKSRVMREVAEKIQKYFVFESKVGIPWSDSANLLKAGKYFEGIPYGSYWKSAHYVGFDVTPFTALSAAADEYSIFYDKTPGRSRINAGRGGTGYGTVCSAYISLISGNPYPQTNRGMSYDSNYEIRMTSSISSGGMLIRDDFGHIVMVDDIFKKGYSLYEGVQPTSSHTYRTVDGSRNGMLQSRARESYCDDYTYLVNNKDVSGFEKSYLDFENIEIVNGSIRPWTGNKSVLGNYDKSHGGIWITVHDDARVAHITKPDGSIVDVDVQGKTVVEITEHVTVDGEYSLHSDASDVKEYFRFFDSGHIELRFDNNGKAIFSNPDVDYAYITAEGYGIPGIKDDDDDEGGSMVVANGKYYPLLTDDKIHGNAACMIWNEWGRYSSEFELTVQENENEHTPSDTEEPEQEGTVTDSESE